MGVISIKELLEAGVHFGHQTNRWNPKMKRYIFGERNGIYIIDLQQTVQLFDAAYGFVRDTAAAGESVLFVGTKRQAVEIIEELEPTKRALYTGSLGYISFSGDMDLNILIRTLLVKGEEIFFHVGSGIVADSIPEDEYQETLIKSRALHQCIANLFHSKAEVY